MMTPPRKELSGIRAFKIVAGAVGAAAALWLIYLIRSTLFPFLVAFLVAYILGPLVDRMEARGIRRIVGVLIIYVTLLLFTVSVALFFLPYLASEVQDLSHRIIGGKRDWTFSISNIGGQDLTIEKIESPRQADLTILEPSEFPLVIEPSSQTQVTVRFSPSTAKPVRTHLKIHCNDPKRANNPVNIWIEANHPSSALPREHTELRWEYNVYWPAIAVSDTARYLGEVEPSYLAKFMDKVRALQPKMEVFLPILRSFDLADELEQWGSNFSTSLVKHTPELIGSLISGITFVVIVPFVVFFLLSEGRSLKRSLIELVPNRHFELVLNLLYRIDKQLGGFLRGVIIYAMIVAGLSMIGLRLIGLRYYIAVGIFTGLASMIPYFGAIMGVMLGSVAAMFQNQTPEAALPVVVVFLVIHLLDGVFISPLVMARNVDLHPVAVIFVLLMGAQLLGVAGMIIAVPLAAILKVSARTIYDGLKSYSV
ncbi:MAG: AI-2E family transporter [Candidatus Latescibacteria bacterium]|nr:AI-2E family transporter [Candidatus Latescibacterota bacterium]